MPSRRKTTITTAEDSDGAQAGFDSHPVHEPVDDPEAVYKLTYRLIEDLQRVRLAHGNRIRRVLPYIPPHLTPPRGHESWEKFFATSADVLQSEEQRVLKLAERLLKEHEVGRWLLAQKGVGVSLAISILGEIMPWPAAQRPSPSHLYSFAGLDVTYDGHGVSKRHARVRVEGGEKSYKWNWRLKTRLYLFATSVLKSGGPWRVLYDRRKWYELAKVFGKLSAPSGTASGESVWHTTLEDYERLLPQALSISWLDYTVAVKAKRFEKAGIDPTAIYWLDALAQLRALDSGPLNADAQRLLDPVDSTLEPPSDRILSPSVDSTQETPSDRALRSSVGSALGNTNDLSEIAPVDSTTPQHPYGVAHRRAMRYVMKAFVRDLWRVVNHLDPVIGDSV